MKDYNSIAYIRNAQESAQEHSISCQEISLELAFHCLRGAVEHDIRRHAAAPLRRWMPRYQAISSRQNPLFSPKFGLVSSSVDCNCSDLSWISCDSACFAGRGSVRER